MSVQKHTNLYEKSKGIYTPDHNPFNYLRIQALNPNLQDFEREAIEKLIKEVDPGNYQNNEDQQELAFELLT